MIAACDIKLDSGPGGRPTYLGDKSRPRARNPRSGTLEDPNEGGPVHR